MSDEWVITPPCSPVFGRKSSENSNLQQLLDKNHVSVISDWDIRMFTCKGELSEHNDTFHENGYVKKNDLQLFDQEYSNAVVFDVNFSTINLFGLNFDKGSALLKETDEVFRLAKASFMQLDCASTMNVNSLGMNVTTTRKTVNYAKSREDIVNFLLYVRNYVQRICICNKYKWLAESLVPKLYEELTTFRLLCGPITSIPDYVINYSASSSGDRSAQASYHFFHCQLDIRWLHVTLLYQLISFKQRFKNDSEESQYYHRDVLTYETLDNNLLMVTSDLITIALKRFQTVQINDLYVKPLFTCTCIREFWKLLQYSSDKLHSNKESMSFWMLVNRICDDILSPNTEPEPTNCSVLSIPRKYTCSNPTAFILWLLKDLGKLYKIDKSESRNNYQLLETVLKCCVNADIPESQMRIYLNLIESILKFDWEMRTEPLILLWEYFHKKLNLQFFIPGGNIGGLAVISKSALGLLTQINSRLDTAKPERNADSFHLFLRLLGRSLRKWQETPRFWNQLKGRIYSKFSAAKLATLNETGLYHFIALFITLAMTADLQEVSTKLQSFLKLLPLDSLDHKRLQLVWKVHISLVLLFAERNQDISGVSNSLLDMVDSAAAQHDCLNLMRIFSEGFQDLIDCTNNLELGQYIFIGNWIPQYLSICGESDANRLLESLLTLINKLNSLLSVQIPVSQDNQLLLMHGELWEHLIPYLKKECCSSSSPYQVADVAAILTTLSLKPCFASTVRTKAVDFFNYMITCDVIDVRLLCRYLGQTSRSNHLHNCLSNNSIILIKGWLRCSILTPSSESSTADLNEFTNYVITLPELESLFSETNVEFDANSDHFEIFLKSLERKYTSVLDFQSRTRLYSQVAGYFANTDRWLNHILKVPKSSEITTHVYQSFGLMMFKIPNLLYTKSRSNTLLQCLLDLLLLSVQARNPQNRLNPLISEAIKNSIHLYIQGLFKLDPLNDSYIMRSIRELVTIYVPRLIVPKGVIAASSNSKLSILKCFENGENCILIRKTILEVLCITYIKKRAKSPHQFAYQTLIFFNELIRMYRNTLEVIECFVKFAMESICDVFMFCDDLSPCKRESKDIIHFIMDMHMLRSETTLGNELMNLFSRLCHEHLAFNARVLFDLFHDIVGTAPDLVARFTPQFLEKIKEVEHKRGVGFDRALRKGLERIDEALKNIRNNQKYM
ncbi:protein MMS22-like [Planococcus citri]|uniref:protein MMS22-like n=1 Tax=Planococcus citri TaxID=170843 RepID=UPI0031F8BD8D